jgi:hypothetical protein
MYTKKIFILLLALVIILLTIPSCNGTETDSLPSDFRGCDMNLSLFPVPKLGETAELTFIPSRAYTQPYPPISGPEDLTNAQAWVAFFYANTRGSYSEARYAVPVPLEEVLVDGELSWEGNALEDELPELHATIQLPREGVWIIIGYLSNKGWEKPLGDWRFFAITEDAAAMMGTDDFESGPLGYLANFDYGGFGKKIPDESFPVVLELDISKVPRAGEEVTLTCRIDSIINCSDYSAQIYFIRRLEDNSRLEIPGGNLLVDGDLSWEGDLKKGEPVEFSATIKFPEDGDWLVRVLGDHPTEAALSFTDAIKMNINGEMGSFGWARYP